MWKERALERLAGRLVDGVITVRASEHRSQWRNRETAAVRLAALLAEATAPPPKPRPGDPDPARDQRAPAAGEEAARRHQARPLGPGLVSAGAHAHVTAVGPGVRGPMLPPFRSPSEPSCR